MGLGKAFTTALASQLRVLSVAAIAGVVYASAVYSATTAPRYYGTSVLFSAAPIGSCSLRAANIK